MKKEWCQKEETWVDFGQAQVDRSMEIRSALETANKLGVRLHNAGLKAEHKMLVESIKPLSAELRLIERGKMPRWRPSH
jgi:hypothetical protein